MTKLINRRVEVESGKGGLPVSFRHRGVRYQVAEILDVWTESGRWWEQEGELFTFRVATVEGGLFEVTWSLRTREWTLYKSYD